VLLVLLQRPGEDEDVQVGQAEVESSQNVVHKALKRLGGVVQAEEHEGELEKPNGVVMAVFCISSGWMGISLYAFTRSI
jgi:hypothetical protein